MNPGILRLRNGPGYVAVWPDHLIVDFGGESITRFHILPELLIESLKAGRTYHGFFKKIESQCPPGPTPCALIYVTLATLPSRTSAVVRLDRFIRALEEVQQTQSQPVAV